MTDSRNYSYSATGGEEITPSDVTVITGTRALLVAAGTVVTVRMVDGSVLPLPCVPGFPLPVQCDMVHATGTDATGIVALR